MDTKVRERRRTVPEGVDVFQWPEFRKFAGRLGVDLTKTIYSVTFTIFPEQPVRIAIEYEGEDATGVDDRSARSVYQRRRAEMTQLDTAKEMERRCKHFNWFKGVGCAYKNDKPVVMIYVDDPTSAKEELLSVFPMNVQDGCRVEFHRSSQSVSVKPSIFEDALEEND